MLKSFQIVAKSIPIDIDTVTISRQDDIAYVRKVFGTLTTRPQLVIFAKLAKRDLLKS